MISIFICLLCERMFHITGFGDGDTIFFTFFHFLRFRYMKTETQLIPQISIGMTENRSSPMLADDLGESDDDDEN